MVRCEHCGSEDLSYEHDALLVATPLRLDDEVLVLDTAPRPAPLDHVQVCCQKCGRQQGLQWREWHPEQTPTRSVVVEADDALDMIVGYLNEPGECEGADFIAFVCQLLPRTGREVVDSNV